MESTRQDERVIERTAWIDAPRERVWQAVTEPEQLAQWFLPPFLGAQLERDEGGTLVVRMGEMGIPMAQLDALDAPRQMTIRGLPDRLLSVTCTLEEEEGGARVTVRMSGLGALPEQARQELIGPSGAAWEKALENLKAFVAGGELPFPEGYVAALFGYRREAKEKYGVARSIWIDAPRERVWRAITDPEQIEHWFSPGTQWHGTGPEVGGRFAVRDPETGADMYVQVIDEIEPPHRYVTRSEPEPPATAERSEWVLEEERGGTRLTLTFSGYELEVEALRNQQLEQHGFGFGMVLENIRAFVEGSPLPYPQGF